MYNDHTYDVSQTKEVRENQISAQITKYATRPTIAHKHYLALRHDLSPLNPRAPSIMRERAEKSDKDLL